MGVEIQIYDDVVYAWLSLFLFYMSTSKYIFLKKFNLHL